MIGRLTDHGGRIIGREELNERRIAPRGGNLVTRAGCA